MYIQCISEDLLQEAGRSVVQITLLNLVIRGGIEHLRAQTVCLVCLRIHIVVLVCLRIHIDQTTHTIFSR
jgi:hypothetical protein